MTILFFGGYNADKLKTELNAWLKQLGTGYDVQLQYSVCAVGDQRSVEDKLHYSVMATLKQRNIDGTST